MQYRKDRNGCELSVLGFGCMRFTRKGNALDLDKAEKEIMAAYEAGVNYYDTDCVLHEFNVEIDNSTILGYAGLLNDMLVVLDGIPSSDGIEAPINIFTAYTEDGETVFRLSRTVEENCLVPHRSAFVNDGKLYIIVSNTSELSVYEISCT